ncbi:MAG: hypothetical protein J3R72DRAFT_99527 [Linnemannia gamsii]|nr:MAG: hypothetical protein J3R72DRAFT_99527 [Linnemannia gamsii]
MDSSFHFLLLSVHTLSGSHTSLVWFTLVVQPALGRHCCLRSWIASTPSTIIVIRVRVKLQQTTSQSSWPRVLYGCQCSTIEHGLCFSMQLINENKNTSFSSTSSSSSSSRSLLPLVSLLTPRTSCTTCVLVPETKIQAKG